MSTVRLEARPAPFDLDPARAAVLVVDMQHDFASPGGMFHRAGIDVAPIQRAVAPTRAVLRAARRAGLPVVYLRMGYAPDLSDMGPPGSPNRERHLLLGVGTRVPAPDGREGRVLVRDTWGTEIVPELAPAPGDVVLWKTRFSGFYQTDLEARLREMGVTTLVVTGCTTSVCVGSTVRDAMFRDLSCILLEDCMAEPIGNGFERSNHEASLLIAQTLFGWVSDSRAAIQALDMATPRDAGVDPLVRA